MSRILSGRSENAIKNRYNSLNAKGLAETRANELMSKLAPQEKAEFLLNDPLPPKPWSSSLPSSSSTGNRRNDDTGRGNDEAGSCNAYAVGNDGGGGGRGGRGNGNVHRRGDGKNNIEGVSSAMGHDGSGDDDDDDDVMASGGGGGDVGGGSGALQALMVAAVAARDDRVRCVDSRDGEGESDDGDGRGGRGRGARAGASGKRGWSPMKGGGGRWRRQGDAGDGGEPGKKGAKRERGGQARRKPVG